MRGMYLGKSPNIWKLNSVSPNNQWVKKLNHREIKKKKSFELNEN